jgi:hypothetical protein
MKVSLVSYILISLVGLSFAYRYANLENKYRELKTQCQNGWGK